MAQSLPDSLVVVFLPIQLLKPDFASLDGMPPHLVAAASPSEAALDSESVE